MRDGAFPKGGRRFFWCGGLCAYPFLRYRLLAVPLLQRVTFFRRQKSNQKGFAPPLGTSPRLGVPSLRPCSVGPPRWAIHGPARLSRHPCRDAHSTRPAFGQRGLTGRKDQDQDQNQSRKQSKNWGICHLWLRHCYPSKLHTGFSLATTLTWTKEPCGSELAREEASTSNIIIGCYIAFASKLAPTGEPGRPPPTKLTPSAAIAASPASS